MTNRAEMKCEPPGFNTAFDALMTPEGKKHIADLGGDDNVGCARCNQCGKWHVFLIPPLEEPR